MGLSEKTKNTSQRLGHASQSYLVPSADGDAWVECVVLHVDATNRGSKKSVALFKPQREWHRL